MLVLKPKVEAFFTEVLSLQMLALTPSPLALAVPVGQSDTRWLLFSGSGDIF